MFEIYDIFQEQATQFLRDDLGTRVIVETDLLLELFSVCKYPGCGCAVDSENIQVTRIGAALRVKATCNDSHENVWSSSSKVGEGKKQMYLINILLAVYTLLSGLNIAQVSLNIKNC